MRRLSAELAAIVRPSHPQGARESHDVVERMRAILEAVQQRTVRPSAPRRNPRPQRLTVEQAKAKYGRFLAPPYYLIDPRQIPFPESADWWWAGVARMATEGQIVQRGKPNYEQAMRYWKNQVKRHYGYRPKRRPPISMMEGIRQHLKGASRRMGLEKQRPADQQRARRIAMAAKLIRAQGTQKKAAQALAAQARSDAAKRGWDTRRGTTGAD